MDNDSPQLTGEIPTKLPPKGPERTLLLLKTPFLEWPMEWFSQIFAPRASKPSSRITRIVPERPMFDPPKPEVTAFYRARPATTEPVGSGGHNNEGMVYWTNARAPISAGTVMVSAEEIAQSRAQPPQPEEAQGSLF